MKFTKKALMVALGALAASQAQAAQTGSGDSNSTFYFGASYVRAMYNPDETAQHKIVVKPFATLESSSSSFASDDNGYEVHVGYMFAPNFGVELGYADFGKMVETVKIVPTKGAKETSQTYSFPMTAFTLGLIGSYQLEGGLSVFGRLGGMYTTVKPTLAGQGVIQKSVYEKTEYSKFVPGAGLGAAFNVNDQFRIRAEFDYWYQPTDDSNISIKDLKNVVIGADLSFY